MRWTTALRQEVRACRARQQWWMRMRHREGASVRRAKLLASRGESRREQRSPWRWSRCGGGKKGTRRSWGLLGALVAVA